MICLHALNASCSHKVSLYFASVIVSLDPESRCIKDLPIVEFSGQLMPRVFVLKLSTFFLRVRPLSALHRMAPLPSNPQLDIKLQMIEMGDGESQESGIAVEENNGVVKFKCLSSGCESFSCIMLENNNAILGFQETIHYVGIRQ